MAPNGPGNRLMSLGCRLGHQNRRISARVILFGLMYGLCAAIHFHMASSQRSRAFRSARFLNCLFRPQILSKDSFVASSYYRTLLYVKMLDRITADFPESEDLRRYDLAYVAGVAHLYTQNTFLAKHFLTLAAQLEPKSHLASRMLGRAYLLENDYENAIKAFETSVSLAPNTVMSHQNYAGRYAIDSYQPKEWELQDCGRLLVYDNLMQLAEDFFLEGTNDQSFALYNKALSYQASLAEGIALPRTLCDRIADACPNFDPARPTRLLSYEWVTQFGHIGLLDSYRKMAEQDMIPNANHVVLAPSAKVSNGHYLSYWDDYFCIVRDEALVDTLFPYQRVIGDQFMAFPSAGDAAEPWTRAAARAQVEWARAGGKPLLRLREQDRRAGMETLAGLGLPKDAWYVGLHVREGGFYGDGEGTISEHRSANIEDYFDAIREVTARGGWVIRLGDTGMRPLPQMPNVIDYARCAAKSPAMDVFLLATSRFVVGTTSGLSTVAMSFGTPVVLVNCISNDWQLWTDDAHFTVKMIYDVRQKRYLGLAETYREPLQGYLVNNSLLSRHGYAVHANLPTDIAAAVKYKMDILMGLTSCAAEEHPSMRRYRKALADNPLMFGAARPVIPFLEAHPELVEVETEGNHHVKAAAQG